MDLSLDRGLSALLSSDSIPRLDPGQANWGHLLGTSGGLQALLAGRREEREMAENSDRGSNNLILGILLGAAVVVLGVLGYLYYQRTQGPVVKIDVPGFQGEITKKGVDVEVGMDR
jgi:hypothetical protein